MHQLLYRFIAPALVAATSLPGYAQAPEDSGADAEVLFELLEIRDRAFFPIRIPFSVWDVPGRANAGVVRPEDEGGVETLRGWIWWDGDSIRAELDTIVDGESIRNTSFAWEDGEALSLLRHVGPPDDARWPGMRIVDPAPTATLDSACPLQYGFGYLLSSWAKTRASSSDVRVVGRETVLGRACARVSMIYGGAIEGGKRIPLDVWIDDRETLLVLRAETYVPLEVARGGTNYGDTELEAPDLERDGVQYLASTTWEVTAVTQVGDHWIPSRGRLFTHGEGLPDASRVTSIDARGVVFQGERPELSFELPPGGIHLDHVRDERWVAGHDDEELDGFQASYWMTLEDLGKVGVRDQLDLRFGDMDLENVPCGVGSALLIAHLNDRWCSVDELVEGGNVTVHDDGTTSLADVAAMLEAQGLETVAVEAGLDALAAWGGDVIVHTTASEPISDVEPRAPVEHFMVVSVEEGPRGTVARYVNPPEKMAHMSAAQLAEIWTGRALLVSTDADRLAAFLEEQGGGSALLTVVLAGAAVAIFCVVQVRQRRVAR